MGVVMAAKKNRITGVLVVACLWSLAGCSAYDARYVYQPRPNETVVQLEDDPDAAPLRMLSSIVGVRLPTKEAGNSKFVEAAILLDNTSSLTIEFDPTTVALFSGDAKRFPSPGVTDKEKTSIEPGQSVRVTLLFPFPKGQHQDTVDLNGLNLRWAIEHDGQSYYQSATFDRRPTQTYRRDDYYWGYPGPYNHYFYHRHFRH